MSTSLDFVAATETPAARRPRTSSAASRATSSAMPASSLLTDGPSRVGAGERRAVGAGVRAAARRAAVPAGRPAAERGAVDLLAALDGGPLEQQVAHRRDEAGVEAGGRGPGHRQPELLRGGHRLGVEVVDDLHVVRDEAD